MFLRGAIILVAACLCAGCYTVNLSPIPPVPGSKLPLAARVEIPPATAGYTYDVRSAAAGAGNRFRILVGEGLVQYADAYLGPVIAAGGDQTIHITIESFEVRDFEAHIRAQFTVSRGAETSFDETYSAKGKGYFSQTVWGGAFAMKSSMRKTTDEALRSLFEQFLSDMRARYGSLWNPRPATLAAFERGRQVRLR